MKIQYLILIVAAIYFYDMSNGHKILNFYKKYKKYSSFLFYLFLLFCLYLMYQKDPDYSVDMLNTTKLLIKNAPIDKDAKELFTPLFNIDNLNINEMLKSSRMTPGEKRMMSSNGRVGTNNKTKRSVSETKKKYVASCQDWKCKDCNTKLQAWFEVDHIIPLHSGGTNNVDNLVALCRNCHGKKTAMDFM